MNTILPSLYPINSQDSSDKHIFTSRVENSMDPDQLVSVKPADLDLQKTVWILIS